MTPAEAKTLLLLHSFAYDDLDHPKMTGGFLGSLRPFTGLNPENYDDIMLALWILAPELQTAQAVDKQVMNALWNICHLSRAWALDPDGMLSRNDLITESQQSQLADWLNAISYAVSILLDGGGVDEAFSEYEGLYTLKRDYPHDASKG